MNLSLIGKYAIICGSTQGIGLAIAQELSLLGCNCTLVARNESSLENAIKLLHQEEGQKHRFLVADFFNFKNVEEVIREHVQSNHYQILVNNSGGPAGGAITDANPSEFFKSFEQHLICNHVITQLLIPGMKSSGYGRIINVISTSVKIPLKGLGVSNTIRGAVASWAKTMANELGEFGITVNNILPGATATTRLSNIINNKSKTTSISSEEVAQEMKEEIPLKRFAQPEEIASLAAFIASPAASYISGTSIPVDGGRTGSI